LSEYKGLLLIDEAYIEYTGLANSLQDFVKTHKNVVIIRTFSKAWGLAGLRLGYIIADQVVISLLTPYQNPYSVNRVALYGGMAALDQIENLDINVRNVLEYKANFLQKLQGIPIEVVDTSANFVLITGQHVDKIYEELREQGILVRPRPVNAELKCCLRVTIGSPQEMEQICEAIRGVVNG
jgi:histidinol-phosphate aminotransferase